MIPREEAPQWYGMLAEQTVAVEGEAAAVEAAMEHRVAVVAAVGCMGIVEQVAEAKRQGLPGQVRPGRGRWFHFPGQWYRDQR